MPRERNTYQSSKRIQNWNYAYQNTVQDSAWNKKDALSPLLPQGPLFFNQEWPAFHSSWLAVLWVRYACRSPREASDNPWKYVFHIVNWTTYKPTKICDGGVKGCCCKWAWDIFFVCFKYPVHWLDIHIVYKMIPDCSFSPLALHLDIILMLTAFPMSCSLSPWPSVNY